MKKRNRDSISPPPDSEKQNHTVNGVGSSPRRDSSKKAKLKMVCLQLLNILFSFLCFIVFFINAFINGFFRNKGALTGLQTRQSLWQSAKMKKKLWRLYMLWLECYQTTLQQIWKVNLQKQKHQLCKRQWRNRHQLQKHQLRDLKVCIKFPSSSLGNSLL